MKPLCTMKPRTQSAETMSLNMPSVSQACQLRVKMQHYWVKFLVFFFFFPKNMVQYHDVQI